LFAALSSLVWWLARIRVAMELLKPPQRPDLVSQIDCDIRELDSLIDELLLASKLEALEVDVRVENVDLLAVAAGECAHIPARLTGAPVIIQADPALIHRVVRNLLQNAARHAGGEEIEIEITEPQTDGAVIVVSDRGPGVPKSERERIFEAFYRSAEMPETGDGVGLGLALVRQIAERYNGQAQCRPREDGGTRFEVTLNASPS